MLLAPLLWPLSGFWMSGSTLRPYALPLFTYHTYTSCLSDLLTFPNGCCEGCATCIFWGAFLAHRFRSYSPVAPLALFRLGRLRSPRVSCRSKCSKPSRRESCPFVPIFRLILSDLNRKITHAWRVHQK